MTPEARALLAAFADAIEAAQAPGGDLTHIAGTASKAAEQAARAKRAALALLDGEAEALTRQAVTMALEGETTALRLCLERIAPPRRDTPVTFDLPRMETARDRLAAKLARMEAAVVASGDALHDLLAGRWP